jgi:integrase
MRRRLSVTEGMSEVNGHLVWSTPKAHQSRDVPVPRSLVEGLMGQTAFKTQDDLLFTSPTVEAIRLGNWRRRVWDPAVVAAGLVGPTPHDLRHTAASLTIASGASVKHVQRMLGHKDASMMLNVRVTVRGRPGRRFGTARCGPGGVLCGLNAAWDSGRGSTVAPVQDPKRP